MTRAFLVAFYKYVWNKTRRICHSGELSLREMVRIISIVLCCICLLLLELTSSLKCRTGTQQADDQFRKVAQICKKRHADNSNYSNDSSSSEDDASENSSNVDVLHKFFMSNSDNKLSVPQSWKEQNDNWNRGNDRRKNEHSHSFNYTHGNWRGAQSPNHDNDNRDLEYSDEAIKSDHDRSYNSNSGNDNKERKQACVVQCFFNELNVVDQRGFPEQESIIQLMTHNIQSPELQDFIEEAIIECFYYFSSDMRRDKCYFSQDLLSCLADKGKERCEDWDN